jgi:hypothetical protein
MEQFVVVEQNMAWLVDRLQTECDAHSRDALRRLILKEADRVGQTPEKLQMVEHWIDECNERIARLNGALVDREPDCSQDETILTNLMHLSSHLQNFRNWILKPEVT